MLQKTLDRGCGETVPSEDSRVQSAKEDEVTVLFILLLLGGQVKPITEATQRNVWVETNGQTGSGIVIQTNIVLTNFHILEVDSTILVGKEEADILVVAPKLDLMLLKVDTKHMKPIRICTEVEVGQEVFYVANTNEHLNYTSYGRVTFLTKKYIYTDTTAVGGASGGGLYNLDGCLVGVNDAHEKSVISLHIRADIVQKFLEGKLDK